MPAVTLNLDADLEARVSRYADGVGVPLEDVCERALVYALTSRYPDQDLPEGERPTDPGYGKPVFDGTVDNELPEGEVPVDPGYGVSSDRPDQGKPGVNPNLNPDLDPDLNAGGRADNELPETPEPKA